MQPSISGLRTSALFALSLLGTACTAHLFSGIPYPDRTRPVVRIETRNGVEYGAATRDGILFLGRTAQTGPCRVHYFLGPTPVTEDGEIEHVGGVYYRADIDLKHQNVHLLTRELRDDDTLTAMVWRGTDVERVSVERARGEHFSGDLLEDPGQALPIGTALFVHDTEADRYSFVGLVAGRATLTLPNGGEQRLIAFTGTDRLREMHLTQSPSVKPKRPHYRPDDIHVRK